MKQFRGALLLTITALIWGTAFVAQSLGMDHLGPFAFNGVRNFIAALALLPVLLFMQRKAPKKTQTDEERKQSRKTLWVGGVLCGSALAVASNLQQFGISFTTVGKAGFLTALYIVIVPILGLFLKKRVPATVWVSVVIAAAGTYLLSVQEGFTIAPGDLLVILCALGFSVHILVIDHFTATCDGVKLSCLQFLFAGTWSTILALFFDTISLQVLLDCIWPLLYVGVFSCGVGYTLQILAQKGSNPTVVTILLSLESVFAVIAGAVVLHQQMTAREYLGCVLMFAAVVLAQIPMPQKKEAKAE